MKDQKIRKSDFHPILRVFVYIMVAMFTVLTLYPLFWLFISSLKTNTEFQLNLLGWPHNPTFNNYPTAWRLAK
ncbi:MAG TPA: sugar ABC transporter permease, partial [Firmicutes bacterium]|nr:sugar ABC transporter permease [Bacillota bacterium]